MNTRKLLMLLLLVFCWSSSGAARAADKQPPQRRRSERKIPEEFRKRILARKAREAKAAPAKAAPRKGPDAATKARLNKRLLEKALAKGDTAKPPVDGAVPAAPGGEVAESAEPPPPPSVRIIPDKDVLYLKGGEKIEGTILFVGSRFVIFHTSEGEKSVERGRIQRIQYRRQAAERKRYLTKFEGGHIYLTNEEAPEPPAAPEAGIMPGTSTIPGSAPGIKPPQARKTKPPGARAAKRASGRGKRPRGGRRAGPRDEKLRKALKGLKVPPEMLKKLKGGKDIPAELQRMLEKMPKKK